MTFKSYIICVNPEPCEALLTSRVSHVGGGGCSATAAAAIKALSGERREGGRKMHVGQSLSDAPIGLEIDALPPSLLATQEAAVVFLE